MHCPICSTPLKPHHAYRLDLDRCPACDGLWFDAHELSAYRAAQAQVTGRPAPQPRRAIECGLAATCPKCETETFQGARVAGLTVLRCTQCSGCFVPKQKLPPARSPREKRIIDDGADAIEASLWIGEAFISLLTDWSS